jgi:hypothetical protein
LWKLINKKVKEYKLKYKLIIFLFILILYKPLFANEKIEQLKIQVTEIHNLRLKYYDILNEWNKEKSELIKEIEVLNNEIRKIEKTTLNLKNDNQKLTDELLEIKNTISTDKEYLKYFFPLLKKYIIEIDEYISNSLPFDKNNRRQKVIKLKNMLEYDDDNLSDIFDELIKVYLKELELNSTIDVVQDIISIDDNNYLVDIIKVGQIALYFTSPDNKFTGYFSKNNESEYIVNTDLSNNRKENIIKINKILNKTILPEIIFIPIINTELGKSIKR